MAPHERSGHVIVQARPDGEDVPDAVDGDGAAEGARRFDKPVPGLRVGVGQREAREARLVGRVAVAAAGAGGGG